MLAIINPEGPGLRLRVADTRDVHWSVGASMTLVAAIVAATPQPVRMTVSISCLPGGCFIACRTRNVAGLY
jgi:hypothetical protein